MRLHRPWLLLGAACALVTVVSSNARAGGGWPGVSQKGPVYEETAQKCSREKCQPYQRECCRGRCGWGCWHCSAPPQGMVVSSMPVMTMAPMMMAPMGMMSAAPVASAPVAAAPAAAPTTTAAPQWTWTPAAQPQQTPASAADYSSLLELCRALTELSKSSAPAAAPSAAPSRAPDGSLEERVSKLERDVQKLQDTVDVHTRAIEVLLNKYEGK